MAESNVPTAVYRFYDDGGRLLYVGITSDLISRWREHEKHSPWWTAQRTVSVVWRDSREEAHDDECNAIAAENPLRNIMGRAGTCRHVLRRSRPARCRLTPAQRKAIALEVRVELIRRRIKRIELVPVLGLNRVPLYNRLSGDTQFKDEELQRVADYLGVPVSRFLPSDLSEVSA